MPAPRSLWLTMRDGVRLAADVWLPPGAVAGGARVPAILHQTRYFRRVAWGALARAAGLDALLDVNAGTRRRFVAAGYAWVDLDVRGSGASGGSWPCPWWVDEVTDGAEVVDWIVAQPWSSGLVGATGVSYGGTTAELLVTTRHPAVRAAAPRFSLFDVYADVAFPGGLQLQWFTEAWDRFNHALDANRYHEAVAMLASVNAAALEAFSADDPSRAGPGRRALAPLARLVAGAAPLLAAAVRAAAAGVPLPDGAGQDDLARHLAGHAANVDLQASVRGITHRDDAGLSPAFPASTIDDFSPHRRAGDLCASGAAIYSWSGWLDGGYQHAAIKRHRSLPRGRAKLLLGPWDHGGRQHASPFAEPPRPTSFDHDAELLRFFDHHLRDTDNGVMDEPPVRYFTFGAEAWRTAEAWPPPHVRPLAFHLAPGGALSAVPASPSAKAPATPYRADPRATTGRRSRWRSLVGLAVPVGYGDRRRACERLACFTSAPLPDPLEVTGHPLVHLFLSADGPDAALFAYLEDVAPSGRVRLATEGQLRALHRRLAAAPPPYESAVPWRTFTRADAEPLPPGTPVEIVFDLLPLSYLFPRGHAVRLSIACADADHFAPVPGAAASVRIHHDGARPSRLVLPVASSAPGAC